MMESHETITKIRIDRAAVEDFLYAEAALLDDWRLEDWFDLFAVGGTYHVPSSGGTLDDDPATQLFYISDDYVRLRERIVRLNSKEAHAEHPRSIVQHTVNNVRITNESGDEIVVECNFIVHRSKGKALDAFFGRSRYRLDCSSDRFRIISKRSMLSSDVLTAGKISIII